jgi:hypothetical protein
VKGATTSWMNKFIQTHSNQQPPWRMEVGYSKDGDGGSSSGSFMSVINGGKWWKSK